MRDPITAFGLFVLALFRRPLPSYEIVTTPAGPMIVTPGAVTASDMDALRQALQRQIASDEARDG
ncbi:hypothetical protein [Mesorhizobium sp. B2-8-5]|uniref:hypothetical protein n=1 Tax=Mesorhizobium sp. B2-8-5 TaxID=2589903 RepID=UPI00112A474E|nr:hypothetical protein [Mesorhizobium sp. B2-8-5]UCI23703.1 hypothetical protein FJ430_18990 [Mesorhizobium sp. B2-8-5]